MCIYDFTTVCMCVRVAVPMDRTAVTPERCFDLRKSERSTVIELAASRDGETAGSLMKTSGPTTACREARGV